MDSGRFNHGRLGPADEKQNTPRLCLQSIHPAAAWENRDPNGMNADTIREWLNRRPFEPFELRLSNGEAYLIHRLPGLEVDL